MEGFSGIKMSSGKSDDIRSQNNTRIEKSHELAVTINDDSVTYSTVNFSDDDDTLIVTRKRRVPNQQDANLNDFDQSTLANTSDGHEITDSGTEGVLQELFGTKETEITSEILILNTKSVLQFKQLTLRRGGLNFISPIA